MEVSMSKTRRGKYTDNRICYISKCKGDMRLYLRRKGKLSCFSYLVRGKSFSFYRGKIRIILKIRKFISMKYMKIRKFILQNCSSSPKWPQKLIINYVAALQSGHEKLSQLVFLLYITLLI